VARIRKEPPKLVVWAQDRILQRLLQLIGQSGLFSHSKTGVTTDTRAVAVNDVRNEEILNSLAEQNDILNRIADHLSIMSGVELKSGERL